MKVLSTEFEITPEGRPILRVQSDSQKYAFRFDLSWDQVGELIQDCRGAQEQRNRIAATAIVRGDGEPGGFYGGGEER